MHRRAVTDTLIQRVLADQYLSLNIDHVHVDEYPGPARGCRLTLALAALGEGDPPLQLEGRGVGFVDATYRALMDHFANAFESLKALLFTGFRVRARMHTGRGTPGLDAEVEVTLMVRNRDGRDFWFSSVDRSTLSAGVAAVVQVVEHFVNAERAYLHLHQALSDATRRDRADLVDRYRAEMALLVQAGSFEGVAARFLRAVGVRP
jgi:hypothetical protein